MKKLLTEPLLHFIALGALIFAAYTWLSPGEEDRGSIVVSLGQQEHLVTAFSRTWQRAPTASEFANLVEDWIKEEIATREGQRMGLDADDTIIRRRLRQKLELLAEDVVAMARPDDAQLQAFLEENQTDYRQEPTWTLHQVYFSLDRRGDQAVQDAEEALVLLDTGGDLVNPDNIGDPLPLPVRMSNEREQAIANQFGQVFVEELQGVETGRWQGPIRSGFGLHLVRVDEYTPGRALTLEEARDAVQRDWFNQQRLATIDTLYERLRETYDIEVEPMATQEG